MNDLAFALFIGGMHKLYDDLRDNPAFGKRLPHRPYLLETVKIIFVLGFAALSLRHTTFYVTGMSCYFLGYALKPRDFGVYEVSGMIGGLILLPLLTWSRALFCSRKFVVSYAVILLGIGTGLVDHAEEVSRPKLHLRALIACFATLLLVAHHFWDLFDPGIAVYISFALGYALCSSAYQFHMLSTPPKALSLEL